MSFTPDLRARIKERDKLYLRAKRMRNQLLLEQYRNMHRDIKNALKAAKNRYLADLVIQQTSPNKLWSCLRRLGLASESVQSALPHFSPTILNRHFAQISSTHPPCDLMTINNIIQRPLTISHPTFTFSTIQCQEVLHNLNLVAQKSRGLSPDHFPLKHLKPMFSTIAPYLTAIFNLSLTTGHFPPIWKTSYIIPLKKNANPLSPFDTRPIANPPHLSKVIDSLITQQIVLYLEKNLILHPRQCGFRRFHSTQTALLHLMDDVRLGIDCGAVTILVLFDFSKAFDTLNHTVILISLRDIGFDESALRWLLISIKSFS